MLKIRKRSMLPFVFLTMCTMLVIGCQEESQTSGKAPKSSSEPVTIKIFIPANYPENVNFQEWVAEPVQKKFPNITLEKIEPSKDNSMEQIVASGDVPDIFIQTTANLNNLNNLGLSYDMSALIKQYNIDLGRFDKTGIDMIRDNNPQHWITALPLNRHYDALYYNKDIFDKFGVSYPHDGMSWEDLLPLAKRLTRKEDNVQYRGLEANLVTRAASQLRLQYVDPKTNNAAVNTNQWKNFLTFMNEKIYQIPGNQEYVKHNKAITQFLNDQRLAMLSINNFLPRIQEVKSFTNWDMVSYPYFKENPNISWVYEGHMLWLASSSEHKDAAMRVIQTILSDDALTAMSRSGMLVAINDQKFKDEFAQGLNFTKGKNLGAIYKTTPAAPQNTSMISPEEAEVIDQTFTSDIITGKKDVNTALRDAEEKINQLLKKAANQ